MNDMNCTKARGKWYVYHRPTKISILSGFVGSREDLETKLELMRPIIEHQIQSRQTASRADKAGWRLDAAKDIHKRTRTRSMLKGQSYELTPELIAEMMLRADDKCTVSGLDFDYRTKFSERDWHRRPYAPSLDRINNALGYSEVNVRVVCTCVNIGINEWGLEIFENVCRAVAQKSIR
jgi:hypothetical protein